MQTCRMLTLFEHSGYLHRHILNCFVVIRLTLLLKCQPGQPKLHWCSLGRLSKMQMKVRTRPFTDFDHKLWLYYLLGITSLASTPWQKEVMFLVALVCLSVCLVVCLFVDNITQKLWMDWDEILWRGPGWYNEELIKFWWWFRSSKMSKRAKHTIIIVAWPDRCGGNDPESLGLTFHHQGSTFLQWAMWE